MGMGGWGGNGWGFDEHSSELISLLTNRPFTQGDGKGEDRRQKNKRCSRHHEVQETW